MPNRDLAESLYRVTNFEDDGLQSLDWITRLKIATGAAEGLSYLHQECNPPLVHRYLYLLLNSLTLLHIFWDSFSDCGDLIHVVYLNMN
jgi:hypothetical protein